MELKTISRGARRRNSGQETMTAMASQRDGAEFPIIVHSHLGWDWVWQRPQQFHSRLSKRHPILFVEGPLVSDEITVSRVRLREVSDYPNIVVLQMELPAARFWSEPAWVDAERRRRAELRVGGPRAQRRPACGGRIADHFDGSWWDRLRG